MPSLYNEKQKTRGCFQKIQRVEITNHKVAVVQKNYHITDY